MLTNVETLSQTLLLAAVSCYPAVAPPPYPPRVREIWTLQMYIHCFLSLVCRNIHYQHFILVTGLKCGTWMRLKLNLSQMDVVAGIFQLHHTRFLRTGCTVWFPVTRWHWSCFNRSCEYILSACVLIGPGTRGCCLSLKDISGTAGTDTVK